MYKSEKKSNTILEKSELSDACQNGNLEKVQTLIKRGDSINKSNSCGITPLHEAVSSNWPKIVRELLENHANVNTPDKRKRTPLFKACNSGYLEIASLLVKFGALINAQDNDGLSPLHVASFRGHTNIVDLLIANNAMAHILDNNNWTPLHMAAYTNKPEVIKLLLTHKSTVNAQAMDKKTPLHLIVSHNNSQEAVAALLSFNANTNLQDNSGSTALHWAAGTKNAECIVEELLKHGASPNIRNDEGCTPLYMPVGSGYTKAVKKLLKYGSSIENQDNDGWTCFHGATFGNNVNAVRLLISLSFFPPLKQSNNKRLNPSLLKKSIHSLKNLCMMIFLKNTLFDNEMLRIFLPLLKAFDDRDFLILAHYSPLDFQKSLVDIWQKEKTIASHNFKKSLIHAHSMRHLIYIQSILALESDDKKTAYDFSILENSYDLIRLFGVVMSAKKIEDLDPELQCLITKNIESHLSITSSK